MGRGSLAVVAGRRTLFSVFLSGRIKDSRKGFSNVSSLSIGRILNTAIHAITSDLKDGAIFVLVGIIQLVEVMLPGQQEDVRSGVAPV